VVLEVVNVMLELGVLGVLVGVVGFGFVGVFGVGCVPPTR
jgi:hypothetical protein